MQSDVKRWQVLRGRASSGKLGSSKPERAGAARLWAELTMQVLAGVSKYRRTL